VRWDAGGPGGRAWETSGPAACAPVPGGASRPPSGERRDPGRRDPLRDARRGRSQRTGDLGEGDAEYEAQREGVGVEAKAPPRARRAETEIAPGQKRPSSPETSGQGRRRETPSRVRDPRKQRHPPTTTRSYFPAPDGSAVQSETRIDGQRTTPPGRLGKPRAAPGAARTVSRPRRPLPAWGRWGHRLCRASSSFSSRCCSPSEPQREACTVQVSQARRPGHGHWSRSPGLGPRG
jgi:hypothetical protein